MGEVLGVVEVLVSLKGLLPGPGRRSIESCIQLQSVSFLRGSV